MALSQFEIIVGGLTSIPLVAGLFFLVEKTYGSNFYSPQKTKPTPAKNSTVKKLSDPENPTSKKDKVKVKATDEKVKTVNSASKSKKELLVSKPLSSIEVDRDLPSTDSSVKNNSDT